MRQCPVTNTNCFDPACFAGCQGFDISVEAITVVHTRITNRSAQRATAQLMYGGAPGGGKRHRSAMACTRGTSVRCTCQACQPALAEG